MNNDQKMIFYIASSLVNQKQDITIDAINRNLDWIKEGNFDIETGILSLVAEGLLTKIGEHIFELTPKGKIAAAQVNQEKTKDDFNLLMGRSTDSKAYLDYCEELYGYRMYLFNMMDKQQLDYLFNSIPISKRDTILDLGCGTGSVLNCMVKKYGCKGIGIDQVSENIVKKSSGSIQYINGNIDDLSDYNITPSLTLSIDSLYFSNDMGKLIMSINSIKQNRSYLYYSQYIFDESTKDRAILNCDNTVLAQVLQTHEISYKIIDYSNNECLLYENALKVLPKYDEEFTREGNRDLFERKLKENKFGKDLYDKDLARRFLYIV